LRRYSWEAVIFELNKDVQMMLSRVYAITDKELVRIPALKIVPCSSYVCHLNSKQVDTSSPNISSEVLQSIKHFQLDCSDTRFGVYLYTSKPKYTSYMRVFQITRQTKIPNADKKKVISMKNLAKLVKFTMKIENAR
jgi:hypothetical protein